MWINKRGEPVRYQAKPVLSMEPITKKYGLLKYIPSKEIVNEKGSEDPINICANITSIIILSCHWNAEVC